MIEKLKLHLTEKGFNHIQVNVSGIYLYYLSNEFKIHLLLLLDCPTGAEFTREQYLNMKEQVCHTLSIRYDKVIETHTLFLTKSSLNIRTLAGDDSDFWIVDTTDYKLVIYENQASDFAGLKTGLETLLTNTLHVETQPSFKNSRTVKPFSKYFSLCNTLLVAANVLVFVVLDLLSQKYHTKSIISNGALYWPAIEYYNQYYRLFTYMFLHAGLDHLANNMIVLIFIGDNLERAAGRWRYVIIYFGSGIVAGLTSMGYNMLKNINASSVGASGSIFGVVGAMAYIVAINKGRLENISTRQIFMFVCFSLYGGLTSQGVDNAAHIGGLLAGILFAAILYRKPKKKNTERG